MKCHSTAAFGARDPDSNPGWFAVSNSNRKLSVTNNTSMCYSSKYCKPAMGDTLLMVANSSHRKKLYSLDQK